MSPLLRKVAQAKYSRYAAPRMRMGSWILGMSKDNRLQNTVHSRVTAENPAQMPRLKGKARRKPLRLPLDMDMMLLGPGVAAVMVA